MERFQLRELCKYWCVTDARAIRDGGILFASLKRKDAERYYNLVVAAVGNPVVKNTCFKEERNE